MFNLKKILSLFGVSASGAANNDVLESPQEEQMGNSELEQAIEQLTKVPMCDKMVYWQNSPFKISVVTPRVTDELKALDSARKNGETLELYVHTRIREHKTIRINILKSNNHSYEGWWVLDNDARMVEFTLFPDETIQRWSYEDMDKMLCKWMLENEIYSKKLLARTQYSVCRDEGSSLYLRVVESLLSTHFSKIEADGLTCRIAEEWQHSDPDQVFVLENEIINDESFVGVPTELLIPIFNRHGMSEDGFYEQFSEIFDRYTEEEGNKFLKTYS